MTIIPKYTISQKDVQLSADTPLRAITTRVKGKIAPHNHDYCEACFIQRGRGLHVTGEGRLPLKRGDLIATVPGDVHAFEECKNLEVINVYYLSEWLLHSVGSYWSKRTLFSLFFARSLFRMPFRLPVPHFSVGENASGCEEELFDIASIKIKDPLFLQAAFIKFMLLAAAASHREEGENVQWAFRPDVWNAIRRIELMVSEGQPFELSKLGGESAVGPVHLARLFKKQTGWKPSEFHQFRRVQHAGSKLLDHQNTITDVALDSGFSDTSHFDRQFRKYFKMSPRQYRNLYKVSAAAGRGQINRAGGIRDEVLNSDNA